MKRGLTNVIKVEVTNLLVIMYQQDGRTVCRLHPPADYKYQYYGLIVYDLVRHIAAAFNVSEDDVWRVVELERAHHTTDLFIAS